MTALRVLSLILAAFVGIMAALVWWTALDPRGAYVLAGIAALLLLLGLFGTEDEDD